LLSLFGILHKKKKYQETLSVIQEAPPDRHVMG
jgi:hypothetical protein